MRRRGGRRRGFVTLRIPRWLFSAIARLFGRARKRVSRFRGRARSRFSSRRFATRRGGRFTSRARSTRGRRRSFGARLRRAGRSDADWLSFVREGF